MVTDKNLLGLFIYAVIERSCSETLKTQSTLAGYRRPWGRNKGEWGSKSPKQSKENSLRTLHSILYADLPMLPLRNAQRSGERLEGPTPRCPFTIVTEGHAKKHAGENDDPFLGLKLV